MRFPTAGVGFVLAILLPLALACGRRAPRPEAVPVDRVNCARCGMLVSNELESAQWVVPGEETLFYDDIGCLATDARKRGDGGTRFVHVGAGSWTPAESAFYARPTDVSTPMGYGVVAYADRAEAARRDRKGRARKWDEVVRELAAEPPGTGERP